MFSPTTKFTLFRSANTNRSHSSIASSKAFPAKSAASKRERTYAVAHLPGGASLAAFICYEAIYPGEIRNFAANGAQLFVNISNDGWFGHSAAAEQHLRIARVRAVENRRWLLRVTNSGITAAVDPYGRIFSPLPTDVRAAVDLPYDFRTDETLYTRLGTGSLGSVSLFPLSC